MSRAALKKSYIVFRSIVFSLLLAAGMLYVALYVALSLPVVRHWIRDVAESEFAKRSSGELKIGEVDISPFNEVVLSDVRFIDAKGDTVVSAQTVGAGINLWKLLFDQKIQITYAELISLDAHIVQQEEHGELNIQFIIDAFKSRKEKKEPTRFDLTLNNVVIRRGNVTFDREWCPRQSDSRKIDFNHLKVRNLAADLRFPRLRNDDIIVDLRRLSLSEVHGLDVQSISGRFHITNKELTFNDLRLRLPFTELHPADMTLRYKGYSDIAAALRRDPMRLLLEDNRVTPSDFRAFVPALSRYTSTYRLTLDVVKHADDLRISTLDLRSDHGLSLTLSGRIASAFNPRSGRFSVALPQLDLDISGAEAGSLIDDFSPLSPSVNAMLRSLGDITLRSKLTADHARLECDASLSTSAGDLTLRGDISGLDSPLKSLRGEIATSEIAVSDIVPDSPVERVQLKASLDATLQGKEFNGSLDATVPSLTLGGESYRNLEAHITKQGDNIKGEASADDLGLAFDIRGDATLRGASSRFLVDADIADLDIARLNIPALSGDTRFSGFITADITGNNLNNAHGRIEAYDLNYHDSRHGDWHLDNLSILSRRDELPYTLDIDCDFLSASLQGNFTLTHLPAAFMNLLSKPLPDILPSRQLPDASPEIADLHLTIYKDTQLTRHFKLPVTLLEDLNLDASIDSESGSASLNLQIPYLQQGRNKLIRDTGLSFTLDNPSDLCNLSLSTRLPGAKGLTTLMLEANAADNRVDTDIAWIMDRTAAYRGNISLTSTFDRTPDNRMAVNVAVNPSDFQVNDTTWHVGSGSIDLLPGRIEVSDVRVSRQGQYAYIHGAASASPSDELVIDLQDINLDYIFDSLNINYVVFGGDATGSIRASELFSRQPHLFTDNLRVEDFTYNHSRLGDATIHSEWIPSEKAVSIRALIEDNARKVAGVDGMIWVTRDSLSFGFDAERLDVGFLKPFMAAFCDDVSGHATGHALLYGSFKDINLTGKVLADNVKMRIGITNTEYTATDTVTLTPGKIHLDNITLHDREGHTAKLNGYVTHEYFHNPAFKFSITDADNLLCYDTNAKINPIWYGTVYGSGSGTITGVPGFIDVLVDMTTSPGSTFTFVIDDSEEAVDYEFLTFTDKRREERERRERELNPPKDTVPDFVRRFEQQTKSQQADIPTRYRMDLRVTATPEARAIIVMDPAAGDRIRAYGDGALRFTYNSEGEMGLYGTYTIEKGDYNFTLQELIVREFKIREGSRITFTGDPLNASLDITAAYRVNASLTDLDKSFATDNDLNRNNVPVEALLKLTGNMQSPDITFDIDLPTLNQDVARKVKSIVSTSDMMNMQMVYLLALNRFYTPDYMNSDGSNNEMASLASATLSTQLGSILGRISDNWSFAPSFRTEKGDFSDMEVDLALSSTLLNNRLIFNGNLGYRDKATSSTSFVGDFDIEYLLNPKGTLRLKAYNHYNDQNYYLRSALTTQGIGIVYKRDFNRFLPGLFRRRRPESEPADSIAPTSDSLSDDESAQPPNP